MTVELGLIIGVSAAVLIVWALVLTRQRTRWAIRTMTVLTLLTADAWAWEIAFARVFGPQKWLVIPVVLVNLILAFGGISAATGTRLRTDVTSEGAGGMGAYLGKDQTMRSAGWDGDRRSR